MTHSMKLSFLAVIWSQSPAFIAYLNRHIDATEDAKVRYGMEKGDLDPGAYIRECCAIRSRKELDTDERAAHVFHRDIRKPFMQWLQTQQKQQQFA